MTDTAVYAAGGVIWRMVDGKLMVLVIHRTAYADVTLPKGKVDPGETLAETTSSWHLDSSGSWKRARRGDDGATLDNLQNVLMKRVSQRRRTGAVR